MLDEEKLIRLEVENKFLKEQVKELKREKKFLTERLEKSYEALTAKEAPMAYIDQKTEESNAKITPEELERRQHARELSQMNEEILRITEDPLFKSQEDMAAMLTKPLKKLESKPLHNNEES